MDRRRAELQTRLSRGGVPDASGGGTRVNVGWEHVEGDHSISSRRRAWRVHVLRRARLRRR